ncbi:restriction endonuclease subunit S [Psychrobacter proteolyticus]|uniref:restriction endonuclease subunit S n=1 Tax=Psychrobacter proteolyticus TaxID=147825 RepID=UPI003D04FDF2
MKLETSKDIHKPEQLITEHIDIWTSAILAKSTSGRGSSKKYELYGITKLRELILELAVRGKLVPQDSDDEPASILLEKIAAEKAQLIKKKIIKKTKPLPLISSEDKPYELPVSWAWIRLGDTGISSTGKTPKTSETKFFNGDIPFIGPGQITTNNVILTPEKTLTEEGLEQSTEALEKDIMMVCIGGSIGKSAVVDRRIGFNQQINSIRPLLVNHKYLLFSLQAKDFYSRLISESTGSATPIINRGKWDLLLIGLPPLAEQQRIVAKVDELMLLCDQLEQQTEASIDAHATLVEVLLATLTDSGDADELAQNWSRISEHFDSLFTTEQSIEALKQTVLQLAVMGKLVPQNPDDEPASVLLEKIAEEKEQLIKEKRIRDNKSPAKNNEASLDCELPLGWTISCFGDITFNRDPERVPLSVDVRRNRQGSYDYYGASGVIDKIDDFLFDKPLLLIGEDGANLVNRSTPIAFIARGKYWVNNHAHVIDGINEALLLYLSIYINSISLKPYITGTAQPKMNQAKMNSILVMLPPLAEQHRIVTKVDELMAICDQLKEKLQQSQETQVQLTDALIDRALG